MTSNMKRLLSMVLVVAMFFSLLPALTVSAADTSAYSSSVAPADSHVSGEFTGIGAEAITLYTANSGNDVLVIQSSLPWKENSNTEVLGDLASRGYHDGYAVVSMADAVNVQFTDYSMVVYANDQEASTYSQYDLIRVALEQYIYNGGVVLFGACDNGWGGGELTQDLPGGVTKYEDMSDYNYIADFDHPIVTGELTGGAALTDNMLYSNHCSHTSFNPESLPAGHRVILRSSNTDDPTLVEYPYGNGRVIASGLTWEFGYSPSHDGEYSKNSFDDYFAYGLNVAGVEPEEVDAVLFDYDENTRYEELTEQCVTYALLAYRSSDAVKEKGRPAYYIDGNDGTLLGKALHNDGYQDLQSYYYKKLGNDHITAMKAGSAGENTSLYTIGHRKVKDNDGYVYDQLVVVFRGTYDQEWYGNFDLTGKNYDPAYNYSWSFQNAVDLAMADLSNYIDTMKSNGKMGSSNLKIMLTGHSRGAAVSNMMAHELTDIENGKGGRNASYFSDKSIADVYAYTFATPNVASYDKITSYDTYSNIFNYCFTDDFVPNLPLEAWGWGKYGKTYWATAAKLKDNKTFYNGVKTYFAQKPEYKTKYTETIAKTMGQATKAKKDRFSDPIKNYYDLEFLFGKGNWMSMYDFIRANLAGSMQSSNEDAKSDASAALVKASLGGWNINNYFQDLAWNLVKGGKLDSMVDIGFGLDNFHLNGPLGYTHECGSYYTAVRTMYSSFSYNKLTSTGYADTLYSDGTETDTVEPDQAQVDAMKAFLEIRTVNEENGIDSTNAEFLGWDIEDIATWDGVTWNNGSVISLDMAYSSVSGVLDLTEFPDLEMLDVSYCNLTALTGIGSTALTSLECSGNELTELDLTGASLLVELNCTNNPLTSLDLTSCTALESLDCIGCLLTNLVLNSDALMSLSCSDNYLDTEDDQLNAIVAALSEDEDGYVDFLPQNIPDGAEFDADDLDALLAIANTEANLDILSWNLESPASWYGIEWIQDGGMYHLETVSFDGLGLTGAADFSDCDHLTYLILSNNSFTDLNVDGCVSLESFWVDYNYLDENVLSQFVEQMGIENFKIGDQRSLKNLNADDVALLNALSENQDLGWDPALYANNPALTWTEDADGIWILTGMDLTGTDVSGLLDLFQFRHLTSVICSDSKITDLILPEVTTRIHDGAFANNTQLKSVTVPASVSVIGEGSFSGCSRLSLVDFMGKAPALLTDCFADCKENLTLNLHFQFDTTDLMAGEQLSLSANHFPENSNISWNSSKESVAQVNENGIVTAIETGTALITAKSDDGFSATCTVVVPDHTHEFTYTDNQNGTHTKACANCDRVVTEEHTYVDSVCICGAETEHVHSYTAVVTEPTCTEDGYITYTCACGDTYTEVIAATGHAYDVTESKEATCEEDGYVTYTCGNCGDTYTETTEATGHNHVLVESEDATCEQNGYEFYRCVCGNEYQIILEATGHDYVDGVCTNCGDEEESGNGWFDWFDKWFGSWWGDNEEEEGTPTTPVEPSEPEIEPSEPAPSEPGTDPTKPSEPEEDSKPGWGGWFDWIFGWFW